MKKWIIVAVVLMALSVCMGAVRVSSYTTFHTVDNVAGSPDATWLTVANGFARTAVSSARTDLLKLAGVGKNHHAEEVQFIFSHSSTAGGGSDADGATTVFELYGQVDQGPRQVILTAALTSGTARVVNNVITTTWVDTIVLTNYRSAASSAVVNDGGGNNRVSSLTVATDGFRYLEGLFTGAGSTASTAIAYIRYFSE